MSVVQPALLQGMELKPEFVLLNMGAGSDVAAIELLANVLLRQEMVKPSYVPAIIKREEEYCTGLAFEDLGVAIPHTDAIHVNKPCIAIGTLAAPVTFKSMGMPDIPCEVEMLIMLGITEPHTQLDFLKTLMKVFQTPGRLTALKAAKTPEEAVELFKSYFV